jgi:hypothetical protein
MTDFQGVQWQPISQLPLFIQMVDGLLAEVQAFHDTLAEARGKPHALDDAILNRVEQQYQERSHFLGLYGEQFRRWRAAGLSNEQRRIVDRLAKEVAAARPVVIQVLALAAELREQTIDRVTELSDAEVGLMTLLGLTPAEFKKLKPQK